MCCAYRCCNSSLLPPYPQNLTEDNIFKANSLGWCIEWVSVEQCSFYHGGFAVPGPFFEDFVARSSQGPSAVSEGFFVCSLVAARFGHVDHFWAILSALRGRLTSSRGFFG